MGRDDILLQLYRKQIRIQRGFDFMNLRIAHVEQENLHIIWRSLRSSKMFSNREVIQPCYLKKKKAVRKQLHKLLLINRWLKDTVIGLLFFCYFFWSSLIMLNSKVFTPPVPPPVHHGFTCWWTMSPQYLKKMQDI